MGDTERSSLSDTVAVVLRSAAASCPALAWLGQLWSEYDQRRMQARVMELVEALGQEIADLRETLNIHEDLIASCLEAPELLEVTAGKVHKEASRDKRRMYAKLLARLMVIGQGLSSEEKIAILHEFEFLRSVDVEVLRVFDADADTRMSDLDPSALGFNGTVAEQLMELATVVCKLESRGLVLATQIHTGVVTVPDGLDAALERWRQGRYRLLPAGQRLQTILSTGD